MITLRK